MLPRCPILYANRDKDPTDCYHKGHQRSYEVSAVHRSLQTVEAHLSRGFMTSYIVYNEYFINWDYPISGSCITTKEAPVSLQTPFSYTVTADENPSEVQYLGLSSFRNYLGLEYCDIGESSSATPFPLSPTLDGPSISFSSTDPPTSTSIASTVANVTSSPTLGGPSISFSSPDPPTSTRITSTVVNVTSSATTDRIKVLSWGQKAAIGTAISVGGTALLVLAVVFWQRTNPPFLQLKPELQGEDSRHEMPAEDRIYELDEGNTRYELMTEEQSRRLNVQVQQQELRGEEFALEIDDRDTRAEC